MKNHTDFIKNRGKVSMSDGVLFSFELPGDHEGHPIRNNLCWQTVSPWTHSFHSG